MHRTANRLIFYRPSLQCLVNQLQGSRLRSVSTASTSNRPTYYGKLKSTFLLFLFVYLLIQSVSTSVIVLLGAHIGKIYWNKHYELVEGP